MRHARDESTVFSTLIVTCHAYGRRTHAQRRLQPKTQVDGSGSVLVSFCSFASSTSEQVTMGGKTTKRERKFQASGGIEKRLKKGTVAKKRKIRKRNKPSDKEPN
jgi:hypothetical protein